MKSKTYWKKRAAKRMYLYQLQADKVGDEIASAYIKSTNAINAEVDKIFRTFQVDGGLSESEARKLLSNLPDDATLDDLKSVINAVSDPERRRALLNIINSPAYAYRIKRFEQLQKDIDIQTARLAQFEQSTTKAHYVNLTSDAYYRCIFDVQRGTGIDFSFARMPISRVNAILTDDWSGKLFSTRIWGRASSANTQLKEELLVGFMTGRSYKKTAAAIEERMSVSANAARRLVRTESTHISNAAEMESYKECGIDKYEFVATLDMRTSDVCAALDGKQFAVDKGVPGTNMPPMHAWCRSTTIAVIDGAVTEGLKRRARDPETGETYEVPADMTYSEWRNAQNIKVNTNALDFAKGGRVFENSEIKVRAYSVKGEHNIHTETYSSDAQNTIDFISKAQKDGLLDGVSDIVVSKKIPGIAAYDHEHNVMYINEKITNPKYIEAELGGGYFVAENADDILKHEMFHKKHWDFVLTTAGKKNIMDVKQSIEADLRKYIKEQTEMDPTYVLENVSENADSHFENRGNLNELIAEVLLQSEKGIVKDEYLLELVRRCVK